MSFSLTNFTRFTWGSLSKGFVNLFKRLCTVEPDGHQDLKIFEKSSSQELRSFEAESWYITSGIKSTKFVQMMILG